ncbi:Excinuclease ABC subunit C [Lachnospiraceae bacterium XBB2008]|nr:Excinuclease ABC subunit C [Lachnospiraceae bacterium XBB2008]
MNFDINEELKKLPHNPGVYIMHDAGDTILYVGKAVDLHNRVRSYFRKIVGRGPQIDRMVEQIEYFEYIVTDSELEALILENNLIKEHSPKYNTLLKDDKTYPYIKVTVDEAYPRLLFSREMKKDHARYFGPFTSAQAVRETIDLLNKLYRLRSCNRVLPRDIGAERPCLNYHITQCDAPCQGDLTEEEYRERVDGALDFLNGNHKSVVRSLEEKMLKASEEMNYEEAASVRDLLESVKSVTQKQKITDSVGEDRDVIAMARDDSDTVVQVFFVRDGKLIGREHYYMENTSDREDGHILQEFVKQFYAGTPFIPRELMISCEIEEKTLIEDWLSGIRGNRVRILTPKRGTREKFVELAAQNARLILDRDKERIRSEQARTTGAVHEIEEWIKTEGLKRMEAYDISNTSGFANVGSMVVYEDGSPKRSDYRKFRIQSVAGPDDYACMKEVLTRRFSHAEDDSRFGVFPDIILMDGGRGQVNIALGVLEELGLDIPVAGMVKDDNHRTRGLYYNNVEIPIDTHSEGFKLLTRIQDEAHRFAIEYHRSLRSGNQVHSVLDEIPGVGPSRRKSLMKAYESIDDLKAATPEDIASKTGIPLSVCTQISGYLGGCREE